MEVVRSFNYLGTVISNTNDETGEIKARILAANKSDSTMQTIFRSKQIHQNKVICNINSASTVLWKCNLDPKTNDRKNAMYL